MKDKLSLNKLAPVLPEDLREALREEGFFDGPVPEVKRFSAVAEVKSLEEGERAVERYISTRDVDRDHEVLDPAGAILDQFKLAPQVLWAHDYSLPPIGRAEWVKADEYGLRSKTVYAETERAEEVWQLIKGGFLSTASVGFIPVKRSWKGDPDWQQTVQKYNEKWGTDLEKAGAQVITTKWILLEYSDVPVPANPNALTYAVAKELNLSDSLIKSLGIAEPEPELESEPEPVPVFQPVRPYTPPPPPEEPPRPAPVVRMLKPAPPEVKRIVRLVRPAPTQADLIAYAATEVWERHCGKLERR